MDGAGRSWAMGAQPLYRQVQVVEGDATVKLYSLRCARGETQATAQDPEALSSSTVFDVGNSSSCSCHGHALAEAQGWVVLLRELPFENEDTKVIRDLRKYTFLG